MGKKYRNIYEHIYNRERLWLSYRKAALGKKSTVGYLYFRTYEAANIEAIIEQLANETYKPGDHNHFYVHEPKKRMISALPFLDRVVQHSIYSVISPMFEKTFLPYSFACRDGKGTHKGTRHVQSIIRKNPDLWCLKMDFKGYFYNIDREVLWREIDKKITCQKTRRLISLFHPREGKGLPIGNLTSQLLANIYGHIFDRYISHDLRVKHWARYMDDTVIFASNKEELQDIFIKLTAFTSNEMKLEWSKWSIRPVSHGVNFLGYRIWGSHKLIRPGSVKRAKIKIQHYKKTNNKEKLERFTASWLGHIKWANSHNLKSKLLGV
jgi:hypothetical protein